MGEIFSISIPLGLSSHLASHHCLPLEALEEARLVRKAGGEQDVIREKLLRMVGLPSLSKNKEVTEMTNLATELVQSREIPLKEQSLSPYTWAGLLSQGEASDICCH